MDTQHLSATPRRPRPREILLDRHGQDWKRRVNPDGTRTKWRRIPPSAHPELLEPTQLLLVLHERDPGGPAARPWTLLVARRGDGLGTSYGVTAVREMMDELGAAGYHSSHVLAELDAEGLRVVREVAGAVVVEGEGNSQTWALGVLRALNERGIVADESVVSVQNMIEPV